MTILVVMGVAGSGKSTVAGLLAKRLGWDLQEGDDLHPKANVEKMASGHPLTDEDRWPWLELIAKWIATQKASGKSGIVTCSALKHSYRDILRGDGVVFVQLSGSREQISERLEHRSGHYMPPSLLTSQLDTLEPPSEDENAIVVDIAQTPAQIAAEVIAALSPT
jgi:gluconokinase